MVQLFGDSRCCIELVLELGAGAALPSLLASTLEPPPFFVTITDHPDETIITNLRENVGRNSGFVSKGCIVSCIPYVWGGPPEALLCVSFHTKIDFSDSLVITRSVSPSKIEKIP